MNSSPFGLEGEVAVTTVDLARRFGEPEEAAAAGSPSLLYFQTFSKMPIPARYQRPAHPLDYYISCAVRQILLSPDALTSSGSHHDREEFVFGIFLNHCEPMSRTRRESA